MWRPLEPPSLRRGSAPAVLVSRGALERPPYRRPARGRDREPAVGVLALSKRTFGPFLCRDTGLSNRYPCNLDRNTVCVLEHVARLHRDRAHDWAWHGNDRGVVSAQRHKKHRSTADYGQPAHSNS